MTLREQVESKAAEVVGHGIYFESKHYTFADPHRLFDNSGLHPIVNMVPIAGNIADAVTTVKAIERGAQEANPFVKPIVNSLPAFAALKLGVGIATALIADGMAEKGHKNLAKIIAFIGGAIPTAAAIHNLRVQR